MVCSSNSPKLTKIETVQRMATDGHGVPTTPKDLAFHAKRSVKYSKFLAGATGHRYSVISIAGRTSIQRFRICNKICNQQTLTAFMNSAEQCYCNSLVLSPLK